MLSRWKYRRACRYIAVSEYVRGILIAGGVDAAKISVVYDGVPLLPVLPPHHGVIAPASDDPRKGTDLATEAARIAGLPLQLSGDLEKDLPGAALFVYITRVEGLGSAVLLAMSAGVPVIASRTGGIPEIIADGETGLLTANDPREIAAAMLRLQGDPALAARLALAARRMVESRFPVGSMISSTIGVYQQIHA